MKIFKKQINNLIPLNAVFMLVMGINLFVSSSLVAESKIPQVKRSVKPLTLDSPPTREEIMAAGQLGGQLYPTSEIDDKEKEKKINLSFGQAIQAWNKHEYKEAVKMFRKHVEEYPDSQWADESVLHIGCDATYNGRYTEAEESFKWILEKNKGKDYEGANALMNKAKLRLGVLKVYQNNLKEAKKLFSDLKKESSDWRDRTYASHWLQRLSRYAANELAMLNCGTQALAYLLERDSRQAEARKILELLPETTNGYSIRALSEIASQYGYNLSGIRVSASELKELPLPAIMHIGAKNHGDSGHYWILENINGDILGLFDPQAGRRFQQSIWEFSKEWSSNVIVFSDGESLPGIRLAESEMKQIYGGCCGLPRPEDDLGGPGGKDCDAKGSPIWKVNMVNMNFFVTDIPMWYNPSIGPSVKIQLSYNSQSSIAYNEPFGNKWMFNYGSYLVVDPSGNVTVFMPDGRRDVYTPDGQGGYTKPFEIFNTLTKIAENHFELKFLDGTVYVYNIPSGTSSLQPFLVEIRDAYGQKLTFGYNSNVQLQTITDASGKVTTLVDNNNDGLIDRIDDPFGRSAYFEYDLNGNLTKITDMGGYWTSFNYDADIYLTSIENEKWKWDFYIEPADGIAGYGDYPAPGNKMWENYRITITNPLKDKEEFYYFGNYGGSGWYVSPRDYVPYKDVNNNNYTNAPKTRYYFNKNYQKGKISKIEYPEGGYIEFNYDSITGKPLSITDYHNVGITHSKHYTYNSNGLATSSTDAKGNITTYEYYPNGTDIWKVKYNLTSTPEDDNIILKTFTYNGDTHDVATITDRIGNIIEYTYNSYGQVTSTTEAQGTPVQRITELVHDSTTHYLIEIKRGGNILMSFTHDNIGRIKTFTDVSGLTLTYWEYNNLNQPTKITFPDTMFNAGIPTSKFVTINRSSCCPRIIDSIIDRAGLTTTYTHDALKRLTKVQGPNGIFEFKYDVNRNLTKLIDADKKSTTFEYNLDNRLKKKIFADNKFVEYTPDKMGLLKTFKNAKGTTKTYTYDGNHNLLSIDYSDTTPDVTFTYDDYDRLDTMTDGISLHDYGYDANNRLTSVDGPWLNDTITYQYNELGNLKNLIPQNGQAIVYSYDYESTDPLVKKIGRLLNIQSGTNTFIYGYTGVNPLIQSLTMPNGSFTEYSYNDPLKRLTDVINKNSSSQVINSYNYTYYTSGNSTDLIWKETITNGEPIDTFVAGTTTYTNNNLNQLTNTTNPNKTYLHDNDGNMTTGFTPEGYVLTMTYDAENRLKSAEYTDSSSVVHRTEYFYSGDSLLAQMKKYDNGVLVSDTRYIRTGLLPVQERDESNIVTREYTWGLNIGGGIGGLLNFKQNGMDYAYLYDGKGNVSSLIDSTQAVVASYRYDVFGVPLKKVATLDQPFRFSTKQYDEQTGLYDFGYRFNSPVIGRWITRDPLGEAGGINLYNFVGNSPCNFVDPWGLTSEFCTRPFYPLPPPYARHCFIRFNGDDNDTLSFDPKGVHPDPAPDWWPKSCQSTEGEQDDDCIKREMIKCSADQYDFTGFNCCHCAEQAMKACGIGIPVEDWPNWPVNPGPQPGEPGYKP